MGGRVGLKGTDGADVVRAGARARRRPVAAERADRALARLDRCRDGPRSSPAPARWAPSSRRARLRTEVRRRGDADDVTTAADTRAAAAELDAPRGRPDPLRGRRRHGPRHPRRRRRRGFRCSACRPASRCTPACSPTTPESRRRRRARILLAAAPRGACARPRCSTSTRRRCATGAISTPALRQPRGCRTTARACRRAEGGVPFGRARARGAVRARSPRRWIRGGIYVLGPGTTTRRDDAPPRAAEDAARRRCRARRPARRHRPERGASCSSCSDGRRRRSSSASSAARAPCSAAATSSSAPPSCAGSALENIEVVAGLGKLLALDPPRCTSTPAMPRSTRAAQRLSPRARRAGRTLVTAGLDEVAADERAHPYMPNSDAGAQARAARRRRRRDVEELFAQIPAAHRMRGRSSCPARSSSEVGLRRHLLDMLARNDDVRGEPQLPRRRLLAAPRAGDLRRDRAAQRVPDTRSGARPRPTTAATRRGSSSRASSAS